MLFFYTLFSTTHCQITATVALWCRRIWTNCYFLWSTNYSTVNINH